MRNRGLTATRTLMADPDITSKRVLILTTCDQDEYVFAAIRPGARAFLLKDTPPGALLEAIHVVAANRLWTLML